MMFPMMPLSSDSSPSPQEQKKTALCTRETDELERVRRRMGEFVWQDSYAWQMLSAYYGKKINLSELITIAEVLTTVSPLRIDRDARRRKAVMVKWFDENWMQIQPLLPMIVLQ